MLMLQLMYQGKHETHQIILPQPHNVFLTQLLRLHVM